MGNKDLEQLILKYSSYDQKIYDNTSIVRDLNIESEHAKAFIEAFSEKFDVDISTFNFLNYFPLENDLSHKNYKHTELTIADLERAILVGELSDDVVNFEENDPNLPPKLTTKNIILGIVLVLVVSSLLGIVAIII
ncbi:uncharacterized protein DUF1493 [Dysgonomonas alginatilytica]|uniref:Uncharacterized protein DUF1493 n=1 Tax=Dysgonomonas alginatilytica TaxID=1605892 RepID=A0A2V3PIA4_9BACT|nr:DUF1493 family protein [Dysgonomonas alginatilytica]PXV59328.1 uncharacterized protein DUF1493 [Dysgonomonas alginatilytica]